MRKWEVAETFFGREEREKDFSGNTERRKKGIPFPSFDPNERGPSTFTQEKEKNRGDMEAKMETIISYQPFQDYELIS